MTQTPDIAVRREEQTELSDVIKLRWTGKLRSRVQQRQWDYAARKVDGEWVVDPNLKDADADNLKQCNGLAYRTLTREKTNVVCGTVEEVQALYRVLDYYADGAGKHGITWMNGAMQNAARRIRRELKRELNERGYET